MDLSSLSTQMKKSLGDDSQLLQALASARELDARLKSLDAGLRELVNSFDAPTLPDAPLAAIVREAVADFAASSGITATVTVRGEFEALTDSQRITLIRVLAESLANIRQHAGATRVRVALRTRARRVYLVVRDNGCGFVTDKALSRAAKRRRLGLIGMTERARLLGGVLEIESKPGGPTAISLTLPAGPVGASKKEWRRRPAG
jgi:signal transduction histidine kinase